MSAAAAGSSAGAGALGAVGAIKSGQATQAADNYNADVANQNAEQTLAAGQVAANYLGRNISKVIGKERASYGASGIDSSQGSALDVIQQSAAEGATDLAMQSHNYAMKAFGYNSTAELDRFSGKQAMSGAYWSAAGSLLGGAGKAAGYAAPGKPPGADQYGNPTGGNYT